MKRITSMILIALMILSCSVTAFAADASTLELTVAESEDEVARVVSVEDSASSMRTYAYSKTLSVICKTITVTNWSASEMKVTSGLKSMTLDYGESGTLSFSASKSRTVTLKCNNTIYYTYSVT